MVAMMWIFRKPHGVLLRKADAARDERRWEAAVAEYRRYLAKVPANGPIWVQLGHCLKEAGWLDEAGKAYRRAAELMPDDVDLRLQMGHLAKTAGRKDEARRHYEHALEADPGFEPALRELETLIGSRPRSSFLVVPARDRALNAKEAAADAAEVARSAAVIKDFISRLPVSDGESSDKLFPAKLHFVFGFKDKGDIPYYGYMAIKSALHFNPGWKAYYYTMHEPVGPNWDRIKAYVKVILLGDFNYFGNSRVVHYAHKADIVRMLVLANVGGAYLDIDSITQKSFADLRSHEFIMGVQPAGPDSSSGLCNAIMFGKAHARFIERWLKEYDYFRSRGRDDLWDYHSVKLPVQLAAQYPKEITVMGYRSFFYPLWGSIQRALFSDASVVYRDDLSVAYCFHLWNGATSSWLDKVDDDFVRTSPSIYAEIARAVEKIPHTPVTAPKGAKAAAAASTSNGRVSA